MNTIKAIETQYKGYNFRSRLEARWAVFFDAAGIEWKYEWEGYQIGNTRYLPDFYLPKLETWAEVKPSDQLTDGDMRKISQFSDALEAANSKNNSDKSFIVLMGSPYAYYNTDGQIISSDYVIWEPRDNDVGKVFVVCRGCGKYIGWEGREYHLPWPGGSEGGGYGIHCTERVSLSNHPILRSAYTAARSARFEHGQNGATL